MPPEPLERPADEVEDTVQQLTCDAALLRQRVDEGFRHQREQFDALAQRFDKSEARIDTRFEKSEARTGARFERLEERIDARFEKSDVRTEALIEKSEARVMATIQQLDKRVDKLESGFRWIIGLQVTTILAVLSLAARLI
jgi:exonuclease VII large subunit